MGKGLMFGNKERLNRLTALFCSAVLVFFSLISSPVVAEAADGFLF